MIFRDLWVFTRSMLLYAAARVAQSSSPTLHMMQAARSNTDFTEVLYGLDTPPCLLLHLAMEKTGSLENLAGPLPRHA